jgi:hypothetical protein
MPGVSTDVAIDQLLAVLAEAFEGPRQTWSYFTDQGAESGLFGTLAVWHVSSNPSDRGAQFTFPEISSMLERADFSPVRGRTVKDDAVLVEAFRAFVKDVVEKHRSLPPVDDDRR